MATNLTLAERVEEQAKVVAGLERHIANNHPIFGGCTLMLKGAKESLEDLRAQLAEEEAHREDLVEALAHEAKQQQEITESDVPF